VPRWYLKGFADGNNVVRCINVSGFARNLSVGKATAAAEHFYTDWSGGTADISWEKALSRLENDAARIARRLVQERLLPEGENKTVLALYLAAQMLRTPFYRKMVQRMMQSPIALDQESALELMDTFIGGYSDRLLNRPWQCLISPAPVFVTTDHPVGMWSPGWNGRDSIGLDDAQEIRWPIDRSNALILGPVGLKVDDGFATATVEMMRSMLATSSAWQEDWLYDHPNGVFRDVTSDVMRAAALEIEDSRSGRKSLEIIDRQIHDGMVRLLLDEDAT